MPRWGLWSHRCTEVRELFHRTACGVGAEAGEAGRQRSEHLGAILTVRVYVTLVCPAPDTGYLPLSCLWFMEMTTQ